MEARYYDRAHKCIVYPGKPKPGDFVWKAAKKTKRDRVIHLDDDMLELIEAKVKQHPTGYLFRTKVAKPWDRLSVSQQLRRIQETHKVGHGVTAYGFRHTFITRFLLAGLSIKVLADLCGTSVEMIEQTYSHITGRPMRNWVMVEPEGVENDEQVADWIGRATAFVRTLPAKGRAG